MFNGPETQKTSLSFCCEFKALLVLERFVSLQPAVVTSAGNFEHDCYSAKEYPDVFGKFLELFTGTKNMGCSIYVTIFGAM